MRKFYNQDPEECVFWGRPIEPLAFYLPPFSNVLQQEQSPLYGVLPKEIRDMVWEYALVDDGVLSPDRDNISRRMPGTKADMVKVDSACALLQTCKAVYLETYRLPMLLNGTYSLCSCAAPVISSLVDPRVVRIDLNSDSRLSIISPPRILAPKSRTCCTSKEAWFLYQLLRLLICVQWQYALMQRVDLGLQQIAVEGADLLNELTAWRPALRQSGAYVAPRFYNVKRIGHRRERRIVAHNFILALPSQNADDIKDADELTVCQSNGEIFKNDEGQDEVQAWEPGKFTARAMVARPLTHLTIRM